MSKTIILKLNPLEYVKNSSLLSKIKPVISISRLSIFDVYIKFKIGLGFNLTIFTDYHIESSSKN